MDVPDIEIVGVEVILPLNDAVMVTVSDAANKLSSSVSENVTVGADVSTFIQDTVDPAILFPARSVPVTVLVHNFLPSPVGFILNV